MPFAISKKLASEVSKLLGSNEQLLDLLAATEEQLALFDEDLKSGPKEGPEFMQNKKDFNKFTNAKIQLKGRLERLKKFKNTEGYDCFIIAPTTSLTEIQRFINSLIIAIKHTINPQEKIFLEILKDEAALHKAALKSNGNSPGFIIPFLKEEKHFLQNPMLSLPKEMRFTWIKEDLDKNPKIPAPEKAILKELCLELEHDFESFEKEHNEKSFTESAELHIKAAIKKTGTKPVSLGWKIVINTISTAIGKPQFYSELSKKDLSLEKEFYNLKLSLENIKKQAVVADVKEEELTIEEATMQYLVD